MTSFALRTSTGAPDCRRSFLPLPASDRSTVRSPAQPIRLPVMTRRLLYVVNDSDYFLSHRLSLARAAVAEGWQVHVATPSGPGDRQIVAEGFGWEPVRIVRGLGGPWRELVALWDLWRLYRRLRPDLAHHITAKPILYGGLVARLLRVPATVSTVAGLGLLFSRRDLKARLLRRAVAAGYGLVFRHRHARVIFQNPEDRDALLRRGVARSEQTVLILGSGVDPERFRPAPEPSGTPLVVLASRLLWHKGVGEFVLAAQRLRAEGVQARFALVGEPDLGNPGAVPLTQLQQWAAEGAVEWWGRRDDMPTVLAACHVFCLPTYYGEGLPKVLLEAGACSRPSVTTDWPGCHEIVRDGETGLLVPPRDVPALVEALRRLIADPALRARLGEAARERVLAGFSDAQVIAATLEVYREVLPVTESVQRVP